MNSKIAQRYLDDGMAVMSKPQLVVRLYERLLQDLTKAGEAMVDGVVEGAHRALIHAQDIVLELNLALDTDAWQGAQGLRSVYEHVNAQLIEANIDKNPATVEHCIALIEPLYEAWRDAARSTQAGRAGPAAVPSGASKVGVAT